jgi:hypothetical protein
MAMPISATATTVTNTDKTLKKFNIVSPHPSQTNPSGIQPACPPKPQNTQSAKNPDLHQTPYKKQCAKPCQTETMPGDRKDRKDCATNARFAQINSTSAETLPLPSIGPDTRSTTWQDQNCTANLAVPLVSVRYKRYIRDPSKTNSALRNCSRVHPPAY